MNINDKNFDIEFIPNISSFPQFITIIIFVIIYILDLKIKII